MALKQLLHILLIINCMAIVKSSIDACFLHHVNITSEPVIITSLDSKGSSRARQDIVSGCTLDLFVQEGNALSIEILISSSSDTYSYLYFEDLNNSDSQCLKKYILTSLNSIPCKTVIAYKACRLHLRKAQVTLKLKAVTTMISECTNSDNLGSQWLPLPDSSIIPRCQMSAYDSKITHSVQFPAAPIVTCPRKCKCALGYRNLSILCNIVTNSAEMLVVYDQRTELLNYKSIGLTNISSSALVGIHSVTGLYFTDNHLNELDADTFKGLSKMILLGLDFNYLKFLPATLFDDLVGLKSLYLSGNQLSVLPIGIFQNTQNLKVIRLSTNTLTTLGYHQIAPNKTKVNVAPKTYNSILNGLVHLENLKLIHNLLTFLSKGMFDGLINLKFLYLSFNPLHMLPGDIFSEMPALQKIYLQETYIMSIPSDIFQGRDVIDTLILSNNQLTTLPASIFHSLNYLNWLDLSENRLHTLPDGIFQVSRRMFILSIGKNKLQQLPEHIFDGMFALDRLELQINELVLLPRGIFDDLISLDWLYLYSNRFKSLPGDIFHSLPQLASLLLFENKLIVFPVNGSSDRLQNLQQLSLNSNNLTSVSDGELSGMFMVEKLFIEDNNLVFLSNNSFVDLVRVKELMLGFNQLITLPKGVFRYLIQIVTISLVDNLLNALPDQLFEGLHMLQLIELRNNRLTTVSTGALTIHNSLNTSLKSNTSSLQEIYLDGNQLVFLPPNIFDKLTSLVILHLQKNNLTTLTNDIFQNLFELFELDISNNNIQTFSEGTFRSLTKVNNFFIERNQITDLPYGVFDNMTSVTYLDMSYNKLTSMLKDVLKSLNNLKLLNIAYNYLHHLPTLHSLINLQVLDASFNHLSSLNQNIFQRNTGIIYISLDNNAIFTLPVNIFQNQQSLQVLTCANNLLDTLPPRVFGNLTTLVSLKLSYNNLSDITELFWGLPELEDLEIQHNTIHTLPAGVFDHCKKLKFVNFSTNSINIIGQAVFSDTNIQTLDLRSNNLYFVTKTSFTKMQDYTVLVDESATCCFADKVTCISENPRPVYLTCRRLLNGTLLQMSMWSLGLFTSVFNILVFCIRCMRNQSGKIQGLLISHLSLSDFLMGVNMLLLAAADVIYGDYFPSYSDQWRNGPICKVASILSILSSELSVLLIALISFDRFQGVKYPFSSKRLRPKSAKICISVIWCVGLVLSVVPTSLSGVFPDVYEVSEVCVGIPIVKRPVAVSNESLVEILANKTKIGYDYLFDEYTGNFYYNYVIENIENLILSRYTFSRIVGYKLATYFSLIVFIGVNLICFGLVAFFYVQIFIYARKTSQDAGRKPDEKQEIRRAMKMSVIVLTDFCTWVPLLLMCILAQSNVIKVNPLTYVWTVAFILPINSAINPFLYTLIMLIEERSKH